MNMDKKEETGKPVNNDEINDELIKAYALQNALAHKGKASSGPVLNSLFSHGLQKDKIKGIMPKINKIVESVNKLSIGKQTKELEKSQKSGKETHKREHREGLQELRNAEERIRKGKNIILRFAPYPSGPLHIGNTRQAILNDEYAKMYNGKLILVIDDTIGSEQKQIAQEAYKLIPEGLKWLKVEYDPKIVYKSDRLETYYKYAEEMIKKGYMYLCSCKQEEMQELRKKGIDCSCRILPAEEHFKRWKKMFDKNTKPGDLTVRLKTSMQDPNPAFRDRVMFRISDRTHPKVKNKYKVWPLLEFSWAIDDHLIEVSHIIRGIDLVMETNVEEFIWDIFKWDKPTTIHTGFFAIQGVKISKSKGAKEVRSGEYIGWNDPRTWSLQALRDRGIDERAIREFILSMGLTKANSTMEVDVLYALNRKYLEKVPRYLFVPNPVKIKINGCPKLNVEIPHHPSIQSELGSRNHNTEQEFFIPKEDYDLMHPGNYRLIHLLNFNMEKKKFVLEKGFHFLSEGTDKNLDVKFIQWLPADNVNNKKNIHVKIRMPDNSIVEGLGEESLLKLKKGDKIQFERFGFVCIYNLDKKDRSAELWFTHR